MNWWHIHILCAWAVLLLNSVHRTTTLIVPQELPSILSLVYSNIPPLKKGTDSRLGFGFRLGEHADFQVVLELGPQKETRPLGDQESETSFSKRQISKEQQLVILRQQLRQQQQRQFEQQQQSSTERAAASWLEAWSNGMNGTKKKSKSPNSTSSHKQQMTLKKQQPLKKPQIAVSLPMIPTAPTVAEQSVQQLQQLYKMATTTSTTTPKPFSGGSLNLGGPAGFALPMPYADQPSNLVNNLPARKSKDEITAELMDVSLNDEDAKSA